jgi:hypothetical protein
MNRTEPSSVGGGPVGKTIEVVFPLGFRAGQQIPTPHGDVKVGPGRRTTLTEEQHAHITGGDEKFFQHENNDPTDVELAQIEAERTGTAFQKPPRVGTFAYELRAAELELEARDKADIANALANGGKRPKSPMRSKKYGGPGTSLEDVRKRRTAEDETEGEGD